jgi:ParB/RepB/Spo0J family partition protein
MTQHQHAVVMLGVELIDKNPYQTRYVFDEEMLGELANSIRENGVIQPVVVRPAEQEGRYILVLGERRLRASRLRRRRQSRRWCAGSRRSKPPR